MVFFSFTKSAKETQYRLCAVATVERKIAHSDIFLSPAHKVYRKYLNLLVRPSQTSALWNHYEPGAPIQKWHGDWLGRIAPHRVYSRERTKAICNVR